MKTIEQVNICPYTGLRSFTEDESLYFKGRDLQVDQITALLEQNKFLMVTGASGEGKSSLIFGGLIPNARAGFFKAKYSNWVVVDFRPERSPVTNMARAIANQFNTHPSSVETELRRGFSSLVDLYTSSPFYAGDEEISDKISEKERREKSRKSANLLIIVDQFEEFFTNPENYSNETLSKDSRIVVNLVLETARISIKKNLPVFVVCTMRSDYIGQCSAFRGLPEYIGFSQFFVPRLKRKDLKQVIEEPALLSGNRISQRLIERLVFDISDGVDQLPILQHALSRIWAAADNGNEEMDLLHYAMVGGMPKEDLPDADFERFEKWFSRLPEHQRSFYGNTGLGKIIEIHANILYENAWDSWSRSHPFTNITQQETKRIIALAFSCLTKIDNSRAVRNRMTLGEITAIINSPKLTESVVGGVLNTFREEGNSFIRPFITADAATQELGEDSVLDITHESLIRNWNKLNQWANREFEYYSTFLDFQKQLDRWKKSGKSNGYLLPIGPLNYFETWYQNCKPNAAWILRYQEGNEDKDQAITSAEETLSDSREFLKKSAGKVVAARAFMKYGPARIATVFAILVMLVLSGFYLVDANQKRNEHVITRVRNESFAGIASPDVELRDKAIYLLSEERFNEGSAIPYLRALDYRNRVSLANEVYKQLLLMNKKQEGVLKNKLFEMVSKNLLAQDSAADPSFLLTETNKYLILLMMDNYYGESPRKKEMIAALSKKNISLILNFFRDTALFHSEISVELNMAIQLSLTAGQFSNGDIHTLLNSISPLAGKAAELVFNLYYPKGSFEPDGRTVIDFMMGYHTLASLYAAAGEEEKIQWCFDRLLKNNQRDYFESARILNNHLDVLEYLYQYGHRDQVPALLAWIQKNTTDNPPVTVLRNAVIRSGYISHMYYINIEKNYYRSTRGYMHTPLCFSERAVFDALCADYEKEIAGIPDMQERNYTLALQLKRKAMFYSKYWYDRQLPVNSNQLDGWLDESLKSFTALDKNFREGTESSTIVYNGDGVRTRMIKRSELYLFPDYRDGWFAWNYHSDYFFLWLKRKGLLASLYKTGNELNLFNVWINKAYELKTDVSQQSYSNTYPIPDGILEDILAFVSGHPEKESFDPNQFYLILANHAFEHGDTAKGMKYFARINLKTVYQSSGRYEYLEKIFFLNTMKELCVNLAGIGKSTEAISLAEQFSTNTEKEFSYLFMTQRLYRKQADPLSFQFLDSAVTKSKQIDFAAVDLDFDPRFIQVMTLSEIGSKRLNQQADEVLQSIPENGKFNGVAARVSGIAGEGNYYRALMSIPNTLTESQDLECRTLILVEACKAKERSGNDSSWKSMDDYLYWQWYFVNYIPN